ncbi:Aldo/keto reductase [Paramyrothecium foliicola]|nr:Aldo/keto reductase [Paramyrothecium foliicola]
MLLLLCTLPKQSPSVAATEVSRTATLTPLAFSPASTMDIQFLPLKDGTPGPKSGFGTGTAWYKPDGKGPIDSSLADILKKALAAGFRHFDCADAYGAEEELGVAIRESGVPREHLFITTKVQDNILNIPQAIDDSLQKLQVSFIDSWKDMEAAQASGKANSIGVSNFLRPHLEVVLRTAVPPPVINQIEFQPYLQRGNHYLSWMQTNGTEVQAFKGLAPLTKGKGGPLDPLLAALAEKYNVEPNTILLNWHYQQNVIAITTTHSPERLAEYQKAVTFNLTPSEMEDITH